MRSDELPAPLRKSLIAYLNAERRGLETHDLKPERPEAVPSLSNYLRARSNGTPANDAQSDAHATAQGNGAPAAEHTPEAETEAAG